MLYLSRKSKHPCCEVV
ncbi:unnamed protein product [Lathyrus oleraceus]